MRDQTPGPGLRHGPGLLRRVGRACARHALIVVVGWLIVAAALLMANKAFGGSYADNFSLPNTSAQDGLDLLHGHQPSAAGFASKIVIQTPSDAVSTRRDAITQSITRLRAMPHVLSVSDPLATPGAVSADGHTAIANVYFAASPVNYGTTYLKTVDAAVTPARAAGVAVDYAGQLGELARPKPGDQRSEIIGVVVALTVLLIGFGSVAAAGFPLLSALVGVVGGLSVLGLIAASVEFAAVAPTLAVMMGLGVGIDYALFLTTRFRKAVSDGADPVEAAGDTVASSGRAVLVAALTVIVALLGLYASGITFIGRLGLASGTAVAVSAISALTLTPALLGLAGRRIDRWRVRTPASEPSGTDDAWSRYAMAVGRRPWLFFFAGLALAGVLAVPVLSMRLGHVDAGANSTRYTDRRAYDAIKTAFGPGANAPLTVVVAVGKNHPATATNDPPATDPLATRLRGALAATSGVATVSPFTPSPDGALLVGTVTPTTDPQDARTDQLVGRLTDTTLHSVLAATGARGYVTGVTAAQLQFRDLLASRLPVIIGVVVAAAFLLLLVVFRGLLVALKAAVLNLLSMARRTGCSSRCSSGAGARRCSASASGCRSSHTYRR